MTLAETRSSHPFSFNRVAFLQKIFGEDVARAPYSIAGAFFAPIFSLQAIIAVYLLIIFASIGYSALEGYRNTGLQQSELSNTISPNEFKYTDGIKYEESDNAGESR
jgi:hypothetical protein